jgi:hypothetical protein
VNSAFGCRNKMVHKKDFYVVKWMENEKELEIRFDAEGKLITN